MHTGTFHEARVCAAPDCDHEIGNCPHATGIRAAQSKYCSDTCAQRVRKSSYRKRRRLTGFRDRWGKIPRGESMDTVHGFQSSDETDDDGGYPAPPRQFIEHGYPAPDDQGDEYGIFHGAYDGEPGQADGAWSDQWMLARAVDKLKAEFDATAKPYLQQLKRNPGVQPSELAALVRDYRAKIDNLQRNHERAAAYERAALAGPALEASRQQQAAGRAALQELGDSLMGRSRRGMYDAPEGDAAIRRLMGLR
jgi:hypothetical protein